MSPKWLLLVLTISQWHDRIQIELQVIKSKDKRDDGENHDEIIKEEEVKGMPYITTAERIGMRKGMLEEAREMVLEALEERFGIVPEDVEKRIRRIGDRDILKRLLRYAIRCGSLEEFEERLAGV